jgi:deoxycytidylate deaminase
VTLPSTARISQDELVFGFVGPLGVDLEAVAGELAAVLSTFKYRSRLIRLSRQLTEFDWDVVLPEESAPLDERLDAYMTAGNQLRSLWARDDAFGLLAINAIITERDSITGTPGSVFPAGRVAYVLRSLKRKEEAALLRQVYGDRFIVLSLHASKQARIEQLRANIARSRLHPASPDPVHAAETLVDRDEAEDDLHGQDVRGLFHDGDFFVDTTGDLRGQLQRILDLIFGHPSRTPTRDEQGIFFAEAASLRSAELGRQVGAALTSSDGALLAAGTNEVPRANGGLYWDGDPDDAREFHAKHDTSDRRKLELARTVAEHLTSKGLVNDSVDAEEIALAIGETPVDDLIEFVRAVHAEMAVITDAARRGVVTDGATLYVTTFPCHHCARHVVASGVRRVVYVAPYPKSLAVDLHGDAVTVEAPDPDAENAKVPIVPFVGVGSRRYLDVFRMATRKHRETGEVVKFDPATAVPRLRSAEPVDFVPEPPLSYMRRERRAFEVLMWRMNDSAPRFRGADLAAITVG